MIKSGKGIFVGLVTSLHLFLLMATEHGIAQDKPSLPYVPKDADTVVVMRPATILNSRDYRSLKRESGEYFEKTVDRWANEYFAVSLAELNEIDQVIYAEESFTDQIKEARPKLFRLMIIKTVDDNSEQFELATHDIVESIEYKGKEYFKISKPIQRRYRYAYIADKKTMVCGDSTYSMESAIDASKKGPEEARWYQNWQPLGEKAITAVVEQDAISTTGLLAYLAQQPSRETDSAKQVEYLLLGIEPGQTSKLNCRMVFPNESDARAAATFVEQALEMAWGFLKTQEESFVKTGQQSAFKIAGDTLKATEVKAAGKIVELSSSVKIDFKSLEPMFESNYRAMIRTDAANNLRQVTMSMHNFASAHGHFPSPVMVSDAGKKYSWRIAILPYVGEQDLYDQYRFDEEWNSPHNSKVTAKMPDFFRSNSEDKESTNTSWFLLNGAEGIYGGEKPGRFESIRDGTSNTIVAVEADRAVHWAEPVDIDVDQKTGLPKLGGFHQGGFNAAFADGSVRFISENTDPEVLWNLYTASGGEVVNNNQLNNDDD